MTDQLRELSMEEEVPTPRPRARTPYWRSDALVIPVVSVAAVLAVWELIGQLGLINSLFFSYPSKILSTFDGLWSRGLGHDLVVSGTEFALAFLLALVGIPLGLACGSWRRLRLAMDPFISALYATPMVALTPLFIVWFGLGITSKVAVAFILGLLPILVTTMSGVQTVETSLISAARTFGARRIDIFWHVVCPSILPFILTGIRIAVGPCLVGVIIGEYIGSTAGLGHSIIISAQTFQTADYLAVIMILMVASIFATRLLQWLEHRMAPWRSE